MVWAYLKWYTFLAYGMITLCGRHVISSIAALITTLHMVFEGRMLSHGTVFMRTRPITHTHTLQKQLVCQRVFFLLVIHDRERLNSVGCVLRSHWLPSACTAGSAGFKITGLHLLSLVPYLLPLPCSAQWLGPVSIPGNKLTNLCTCGKHFKDKEWGEEEVVCSKMWGEKYERRNLRCVRPRQSHLREKCWENLTFYTCISGEEGQERERREGN